MPVKIRLQRHGKKGKPFYWIVAADSRATRDGKFLEKLGIYNPNTNPATIEISMDDSVRWLQNGAQPTDTARAILSYKGILLKHHLLGGVRKGVLTEEQVEEKFNAWLADKEKSVSNKVSGLDKAKADAKASALKAEKEVNQKRALAAVEAEAPVVEEVVAEEAKPEVVVEVVEETVTSKAPAAEEAVDAQAAKEEVVEAKASKEEVVEAKPAKEEVVEAKPAKASKEEVVEAKPVKEKVVEANTDSEEAAKEKE